MTFAALRDLLPVLSSTPDEVGDEPWPRIGRGGVSFSDDLRLGDGARLGVRVRVTDRDDSGLTIDLRDSDADPSGHYGLGVDRARTACLLALGDALALPPHAGWRERVELLTEGDTWLGGTDSSDAAAIALGMARVYDAVLGALANAWPGRVGAGSCSLGAVVELRRDDEVLLTDVLPGGEGGRPDRPGASAWAGPVLPTRWPDVPSVDGVTIEGSIRDGSGGGGKRDGGHGVTRSYLVDRPLHARLAFDRVANPPHGIDRAGPPLGTEVRLHLPDVDRPQTVEPWAIVELPAGSRLVVHTCGGAGWGFPGYGDIEWDPSEWFGSKAKKG